MSGQLLSRKLPARSRRPSAAAERAAPVRVAAANAVLTDLDDQRVGAHDRADVSVHRLPCLTTSVDASASMEYARASTSGVMRVAVTFTMTGRAM